MNSSWLLRLQTIFLFVLAQTAIPLLALFLLVILGIYLVNFLFIQPDKIDYIISVYLEVLITAVLAIFFIYVSFVNSLLNALKFGKVKLAGFFVEKTSLITSETKLYFYNLTGDITKSAEIARVLDNPEKLKTPAKSRFERHNTTKVFIVDAYLRMKNYKKAEMLLNSILSPSEADYVMGRKALVSLLKDRDYDRAIEITHDAIEINKSGMVRNAVPKLFELYLILTEIYVHAGRDEEAFNILIPWLDEIDKHPTYFYCRYNKYLASWYYLLLAKIHLNRQVDKKKIIACLEKSISIFKDSYYAKEAASLLKKIT